MFVGREGHTKRTSIAGDLLGGSGRGISHRGCPMINREEIHGCFVEVGTGARVKDLGASIQGALVVSARWLLQTLAGPFALDVWSGNHDRWDEGQMMVIQRSAGRKVEAMALEGEASKVRTIVFQAVIELRDARFKDTCFPYHRSSGRRISAGVASDQGR